MSSISEIKVLIAEDELPARNLMKKFITERPELKLCDIARNGNEALEKMQAFKFDLVFLDIQMPVLNGIEVLDKLKETPDIIFTTAYDAHAIRAFELGAADYLLKPFTFERFNIAVDRILSRINSPQKNKEPLKLGLSLKEKSNYFIIPFQDIIYISSHGKHSVVHTKEKDFETAKVMKELEEKLAPENFIRIHKQFIINIFFARKIKYFIGGRYTIYLGDDDETTLPVGRRYAQHISKKMKSA
ncbi:MAG: LytTR family DNA-binding domain-containing protein [Leptospira sp.]|nr:LytTR family DNA-binding domain-containing protein [Leptospira sp.]